MTDRKHAPRLAVSATLILATFMLGCGPHSEPAKPGVEAPKIDKPTQTTPAEPAREEADDEMNLAEVGEDGAIYLSQDKFRDHRLVGYAEPDTTSRKLIVISSSTSDVDGNPHQCPLGAYYSSDDMEDLSLTLDRRQGAFAAVTVTDASDKKTTVYLEARRLRFPTPSQ